MKNVYLLSNKKLLLEKNLEGIISFTKNFDESEIVLMYFPNAIINMDLIFKNKKDQFNYESPVRGFKSSDFNKNKFSTFEASVVSTFVRARKQKKKVILMGEFACGVMASLFQMSFTLFPEYVNTGAKHKSMIPNESNHMVVNEVSEDDKKETFFIKSNHSFGIEPRLDEKFKNEILIFATTQDVVSKHHLISQGLESKNYQNELACFLTKKQETLFIIDDCFDNIGVNEEYLLETGKDYIVSMLSNFEEYYKK